MDQAVQGASNNIILAEGEAGGPVVVNTPAPTATTRTRSKRKNGKSTGQVSSSAGTVPASADQSPTITLTLPRADYDWFSQQAKEAEYEPTLAKYLQWQLRRLAKEQRVEMECRAEAKQAAANATGGLQGSHVWLQSREVDTSVFKMADHADEATARAIYNDGKAGAQ